MLDFIIVLAFCFAALKWNAGVMKLPIAILIITSALAEMMPITEIVHLVFAAAFAIGYLLQPRRNTLILAPYLIMTVYQIVFAIYLYSITYASFLYHAHDYVITFIYSLFILTSYRCRFVRDSITTNDSRCRSLTARYNSVSANEARAKEGC